MVRDEPDSFERANAANRPLGGLLRKWGEEMNWTKERENGFTCGGRPRFAFGRVYITMETVGDSAVR